jgi:hypothetical protein
MKEIKIWGKGGLILIGEKAEGLEKKSLPLSLLSI